MKPRIRSGLLVFVISSIVIYVLVGLALQGYSAPWTGFADFTKPSNDFVRGKTLWDWMQLFIIPIFLSVGIYLLNRADKNTEHEIATDRQCENTLRSYLDQMANLLLKEELLTTDKVEVRDVARVQTLTVLRTLDKRRIRFVLDFLVEAKLICKERAVVSLAGADLSGAELVNADINDTNLEGVNLVGANLCYANIKNANLTGANLLGAKLDGAILTNTDLSNAYLQNASLHGARMECANLTSAQMEFANLKWAILENAKLLNARLQNTKLNYAVLNHADLSCAGLLAANLSNASLKYANLNSARLDGAKLKKTNLKGAMVSVEQLRTTLCHNTIMPDGTTVD